MKKFRLNVRRDCTGWTLWLLSDEESLVSWIDDYDCDAQALSEGFLQDGCEHIDLRPGDKLDIEWLGCFFCSECNRYDNIKVMHTIGNTVHITSGWVGKSTLDLRHGFKDDRISVKILERKCSKGTNATIETC